MSSDREHKLQEARVAFKQLFAEDSGVRNLTEATRANDADSYDPNATLNAFTRELPRSVGRFGKITHLFAKKK